MTQFPEPVPLPASVTQSRLLRRRSVLKAAWCGVFLRLFVVIFELYGVFLFESSSLLLDALGSAVDMIFSLVLIFCIRIAARPPDKNHPFGHGRFEPLAGLQLGMLLLFIGIGMFGIQSYLFLQMETGRPMNPQAWMFALVPTVLFEFCYHMLHRTAKKQHSTALAAEAKHYRVDALTSLFAMIALGLGAYDPSWSLKYDHVGALCIAAVMIIVGFLASRENIHQLMDRTPDQNYFSLVQNAAKRVKGVMDTEKVRIQLYGPDAHVDIDVEVDPQLPVEDAHRISQLVRAEIQKDWPAVQDVTVHIEPFYPDDH